MKQAFGRLAAALAIAGIAVVALAAGACGGQEQEPPAAVHSPGAAAGADASELVSLLPASGTAGWSRTREPQVFGPGNLWEHINGAAETYLGFGLQEAATAGYTSGSGLEATVDIFRMADSVNAFGIYRQELNPAAEPVDVGDEGHSNANVLNFRKGRDYVKITALTTGEGVQGELLTLAGRITAASADSADLPPEVGFFPPANLVQNSVKYIPRDYLGQSFLEAVFEADYRDGEAVVKLATTAFGTPEEAAEALERYKAFVATGGKVRSDIAKPGDGGFVGDDTYYGRVAVVRTGSRLVFALGASSDQSGIALVDEFLARAAG